ncbi:hypothetical protein BD626DRAFT_573251 [Schizophyllum amplum]|uniref:Uncharacterized protein n=1 Tax=Schizophyllum amplum TaxID=97359 RepID=A0A550C1Q9_9AGAR|nr:hypothetical protein BD626DRAFT_573251 [Auriculariopsis ampla]
MQSIPSEYIYFDKKCTITGSTDDLSVVSDLLHTRVTNNQTLAYRMEWNWGLPRGGLKYYIASPLNDIWRAAHGYCRALRSWGIILAPTFKTYMDAMEFSKRAGSRYHETYEATPRRPLTALCPPSGVYRYIYFPLTDAARELQDQLQLGPQTDDDWNMGIHPATGRAMDQSVRQYPVVEAPTHPVSICSHMVDMFNVVDYSAHEYELAPFRQCLWRFLKQWNMDVYARVDPPEWFINDSRKGWDDETLCSSEATGYLPIDLDAQVRAPAPRCAFSDEKEGSQSTSRVSSWLSDVIRPARASARPSKIPRHTSLLVAAHTSKLACSQGLASTTSPVPANVLSPCRKLDIAMIERSSSNRNSPAWVLKQDGSFPSHTFSSNDWALFYYGVRLGPTFADTDDN